MGRKKQEREPVAAPEKKSPRTSRSGDRNTPDTNQRSHSSPAAPRAGEKERSPCVTRKSNRTSPDPRKKNVDPVDDNNSDSESSESSEDSDYANESPQGSSPNRCERTEHYQYLWGAGAFVVLIALLAGLVMCSDTDNKEKLACVKLERPADDIKSALRKIIPDQPSHFYRVITSSMRGLRLRDKPACIMLAYDETDVAMKEKIGALADRIECALSEHEQSKAIEGSERRDQYQRSSVEMELSEQFAAGNKVAIIYDVDKLSFETAKIFYKFCDDNDDPQHPGTLLLLTIGYNKTVEPSDSWLEQHLRRSWSDNNDEITPILSRVANSLAVIHNTA